MCLWLLCQILKWRWYKMNGYDRLKEQYLALEDKEDAIKRIITHLMKLTDMSELYLKEEKNLEEMMKYVKNQARKKAVNNVAVIEDTKVYEWAVTYFTKSNEELGLNKPTPVKLPSKTTKTPKNDEPDKDQLKLEF